MISSRILGDLINGWREAPPRYKTSERTGRPVTRRFTAGPHSGRPGPYKDKQLTDRLKTFRGQSLERRGQSRIPSPSLRLPGESRALAPSAASSCSWAPGSQETKPHQPFLGSFPCLKMRGHRSTRRRRTVFAAKDHGGACPEPCVSESCQGAGASHPTGGWATIPVELLMRLSIGDCEGDRGSARLVCKQWAEGVAGGCRRLSPSGPAPPGWGRSFASLEELRWKRPSGAREEDLRELRLLRCLLLQDPRDVDLAALRLLPALESLELASASRRRSLITDAGLKSCLGSSLTSFSLRNASRLTDTALSSLGLAPSLTSLDLRSCTGLTAEGLACTLPILLSLESLELRDWRLTTSLLSSLALLPSLSRLALVTCDAAEADLSLLSRSLTSVSLSGCQGMYDERISGLRPLTSLCNLGISGSAVTRAGLARIKPALAGLSSLDLGYCAKLTDCALRELRHLPALRDLSLAGSGIGDAALAELRRHPSLTALNLSASKITDAGLAKLRRLTSLRTLGLSLCGIITDRGVLDLILRLQPTLESISLCSNRRLTPRLLKQLPEGLSVTR